jgi:hypothetical protein
MEKFFLEQDIRVLYVQASSFPEGISEAHNQLHRKLVSDSRREFYGISFPISLGKLVYKAAVKEQYDGEAEKLGCEIFIIKNGQYICKNVTDYPNNLAKIGETFRELLQEPSIDPQGCCVEMYLNDRDVRCMIRLT